MRKRILLVDDELNFLFVMNLLLKENHRYDVRTCHLASQVAYVAHEFKPDLILLDCMMPGMDGGELAGQLQADPQIQHVPFLFFTATVSRVESTPSKCYGGVQTYVPKHIEFEELCKLIEEKTTPRENAMA